MTFDQWLLSIKPTEIGAAVLLWAMVIGIGLFVTRQVWPWFTKEYFPARVKRAITEAESSNALEKERVNVLTTMRDALIELKVIAGQQLLLMQTHDTDARKTDATLLEQQRDALAALTKLGDKHASGV